MNAVDKYDYKVKTEEMLELMEDGAYRQAAEIADEIDWKRVRNTGMLASVSEIYEKNKEYPKAYEVLNLAYRRAEGSRKIISRLCTLAVKTGNVDEAIDYYDDFIQIAPKDPNQYILRYQILRAQRAPVEQQIEALEEYKKSEYIEEWAYELAKLYQEAGMTAECLEECDDLILWFSEGQYVYKAMELKMKYKPLTPSQQEKYDRRYEKLSEETEEMPDVLTYAEEKDGAAEAPIPEERAPEKEGGSGDNIVPLEKKKKIGDTMPLGEALKKLLQPEKESLSEEEEPELSDLAEEIGEIESVADMDIVAQIVDEKKKAAAAAGSMTEITPDETDEEETDEETDAPGEENAVDLSGEDEQITGQMSLEDILSGWEGEPEADTEPEEEDVEEVLSEEVPSEEVLSEDALSEDTLGEGVKEQEEEEFQAAEDQAAPDSDNSSSEGEVTGEHMKTEKTTAPILPPDIQRMIDEIEGVLPPEEEKPEKPAERGLERKKEETHENMGEVTESLRIDDDFDEEYSDDEDLPEEYFFDEDEDEKSGEESEESEGYPDEFGEAEEYTDEPGESEGYLEELGEAEELIDDLEESEEYLDESPGEEEDIAEDILVSDAEDLDDEIPDFEEEFRLNPEHAEQEDDREIPDDDDDGMDILSATTPLSRKETAKMIATGKTAPLPLDEISDALSMSDTGFIVHGRYDLEMQSGIGTRAGLTEEQKKLFSYFVPVRGMSEQLVDVLEQDRNCTNRNGTSKSGNLLIIGNKGNGKTVLAVDVVKAIQKQREIRQGKVAIITGDSLNKKKISDIFDKLYGGALIIEKAGKMNEKTVARLNKAMEKDTGEMLIVLEEQRKPLDRLLSSNREFRRKFTSRLEIPIFINDELVTFGQTYAQENGYRIDEMGILALYSNIDSLQREDHAVTVAEVKEIMDEAIRHSQKASAKKLMKRVLGKNTDEADRIILSEKDFNI